MTESTASQSRLFAVLIGVDCYMPNRTPDGETYPSLRGCVRDVQSVAAFLRTKMAVPDERIFMLTASGAGAAPVEPKEEWPTYENMVRALQRLTEIARRGDQVYVHYSGHGGRTPTMFPGVKGDGGLDESLVPTDIGDPGARYLRDLEIAFVLEAMSQRGLVVTLVLDSCHSGGATRGVDARKRGISKPDRTPRPKTSLVAPIERLAARAGAGTRGVASASGWLAKPEGYVLIAACRAHEKAFEATFDGAPRGVLTRWLLDALETSGPTTSFRTLYDRVLARVHSEFHQQTPVIEGETDRAVFGGRLPPAAATVPVLEVLDADRVRVQVGQAAGIQSGALLAVHRLGTTDFTDASTRAAIVRVVDRGAASSVARIEERFADGRVEPGSPALLLRPGHATILRGVHLRDELGAHRDEIAHAIEHDPGNVVRPRGGGRGEARFVHVATRPDDEVDLQVSLSPATSAYEIWDRGGAPMPHLRPPVLASTPGAAARIARRLVHLARYQNVQSLQNHDGESPLRDALVVEIVGAQDEYEVGDRPRPTPLAAGAEIAAGAWIFLRVKNAHRSCPLNFVVLDLTPGWSIAQIVPSTGASFETLDPGRERIIPLQTYLPAGYDDGIDVLKVIATIDAIDLRILELPRLDTSLDARIERSATRGPRSALSSLLEAVAETGATTRHAIAPAAASHEWTVGQVEIRTRAKAR